MNDRELLELAARAAGYEVDFETEVKGWYPNGYDHDGDAKAWWNPLRDDGDALRLAVTLRLQINIIGMSLFVGWSFKNGKIERGDEITETLGLDDHVTMRRAIVRAAAEIGKVA